VGTHQKPSTYSHQGIPLNKSEKVAPCNRCTELHTGFRYELRRALALQSKPLPLLAPSPQKLAPLAALFRICICNTLILIGDQSRAVASAVGSTAILCFLLCFCFGSLPNRCPHGTRSVRLVDRSPGLNPTTVRLQITAATPSRNRGAALNTLPSNWILPSRTPSLCVSCTGQSEKRETKEHLRLLHTISIIKQIEAAEAGFLRSDRSARTARRSAILPTLSPNTPEDTNWDLAASSIAMKCWLSTIRVRHCTRVACATTLFTGLCRSLNGKLFGRCGRIIHPPPSSPCRSGNSDTLILV